MKHSLSSLAAAAAPLVALVHSHSVFTDIFINDQAQGDGTCVRMNSDVAHCSDPISSLDSNDMACGANSKPVAFSCPAAAGSKLTFEWRMWANREQAGVMDASHKGACAVYAKQVSDMATSSAAGPGWVKIWDEGYDAGTGKWCTEKLIDNNGLLSVKIPSNLPAGNWLFRSELLTLQDAAQFYVGCAQILIESQLSGVLDVAAEHNVSIPGHVKASDPGLSFNLYRPIFPYIVPGPKPIPAAAPVPVLVAVPVGVLAGSSNAVAAKATVGAVPDSCLIKNANWCGFELADYSTEQGCYKASADCYAQVQACYDSAPATGSANCQVWERQKCEPLKDSCAAGRYIGPPNKGVKLQGVVSPVPGAGVISAVVNARSPASARYGAADEGVVATAQTDADVGAERENAPVSGSDGRRPAVASVVGGSNKTAAVRISRNSTRSPLADDDKVDAPAVPTTAVWHQAGLYGKHGEVGSAAGEVAVVTANVVSVLAQDGGAAQTGTPHQQRILTVFNPAAVAAAAAATAMTSVKPLPTAGRADEQEEAERLSIATATASYSAAERVVVAETVSFSSQVTALPGSASASLPDAVAAFSSPTTAADPSPVATEPTKIAAVTAAAVSLSSASAVPTPPQAGSDAALADDGTTADRPGLASGPHGGDVPVVSSSAQPQGAGPATVILAAPAASSPATVVVTVSPVAAEPAAVSAGAPDGADVPSAPATEAGAMTGPARGGATSSPSPSADTEEEEEEDEDEEEGAYADPVRGTEDEDSDAEVGDYAAVQERSADGADCRWCART